MKKLLRIFTLSLAALAAIGASAENPEALYLVGSMNGWLTPDAGGTQYRLTDPDGDGTYTGTFEVPASESLEFKVFDGLYGWGDTEHFYGQVGNPVFSDCVYSDVTAFRELYNASYAGNVDCGNWLGGPLEVSVTGGEFTWTIALKGADQPAFGTVADKVWLIGSFNDFKLPVADNDNGAIAIGKSGHELQYSENVSFELPAGDVEMRLYAPAMGAMTGLDFGATDLRVGVYYCPETSTMYSDNPNGQAGVRYVGMPGSDKNFVLRDWNGGKINGVGAKFYASSPEDISVEINLQSDEGPVIERPEKLYAIIKRADTEPQLLELVWNGYGENIWMSTQEFFISVESMDDFSILLTSEASVNPDPANCWGAWKDASATIKLSPETPIWRNTEFLPFQKGSPTPMKVNTFNAKGQFGFTANFYTSNLEYLANLKYVNEDNVSDDLYLIGSLKGDPQNGGWDITDPSMKLEYKGEGIFTGAFPVANPEDVEFRFYTALGDWDSNSVGSGYDDFMPEVINLPYNGACVDGKGNWKVNGFTGETLYVQVDLKNMKVLFDDEPLGGIADAVAEAGLSVDGLTVSSADGSAIEMYDLYGRRVGSGPAVQAPARGLYIVRGARGAAKLRF